MSPLLYFVGSESPMLATHVWHSLLLHPFAALSSLVVVGDHAADYGPVSGDVSGGSVLSAAVFSFGPAVIPDAAILLWKRRHARGASGALA
jgi:hypothetical protein